MSDKPVPKDTKLHIKITSNMEACKDWSIEVDVEQDTTVAELKKILAEPPHGLSDLATKKVLWRRPNCLVTLQDTEKARANLVFHNFEPQFQVLPFPEGFMWGSATASYQIEGAWNEGGRTPSIWDTFVDKPGTTHRGETGRMACDHYNQFENDVTLMKTLGLRAYRFSISWSRLLPYGRGEINPDAVKFYTQLLCALEKNDITPVATLYHWDLPQCLEHEYHGWLCKEKQIITDFRDYAEVCFRLFGNKVRWWITLNEPWCVAALGYASGEHAPGHTKKADTEPYIAAHNMIRAHAKAVACYRKDFQPKQKGYIGISLNMDWKEPRTDSKSDIDAQKRALDWQLRWFATPIYYGHYPETMRQRCGDRLPSFTTEEQQLVKGSSDFFGLNHYATDYVTAPANRALPGSQSSSYFVDQEVNNLSDPKWEKTDMNWNIVPWGFYRIVSLIQQEYPSSQGILITENGCAIQKDGATKDDTARIHYLQGYLTQLYKAIKDGANVKGYFVWSFMDNFEWAYGYSKTFGIVHVCRKTMARTPKASASMYAQLARENALRVPTKVMLESEFTPWGPEEKTQEGGAATQQGAVAKQSTASSQSHSSQSGGHKRRSKGEDGNGGTPDPTPARRNRWQNKKQWATKPSLPTFEVTLTIPDAIRMLEEFCVGYEGREFQHVLAKAYKRFILDRDEFALVQAQVEACLPIQKKVLPTYGFDGSTKGANKAKVALRAPQFAENVELKQLNHKIQRLISEYPMKEAMRLYELGEG